MNILEDFPSEKKLMHKHTPESFSGSYKVNNHLHTPYSFSAFEKISQIFQMAKEEDISVLGINDFYTTAGYDEFHQLAVEHKIMPLFNIEFIGLLKDFQTKNMRINDPKNPGRTYFTGKGLTYPVSMNENNARLLNEVKARSEEQLKKMVGHANVFFKETGLPIQLDFDELKQHYAREMLRERHIATAIQDKLSQASASDEEMKSRLTKMFEGKEVQADMTDKPTIQNEIRNKLLKKGGRAFVPEDENAFLGLEQIKDIIIDAGGIPCYPVLLDNPKGEFTDFEGDWHAMHKHLREFNVGCVELIPGRNAHEVLEDFVKFFNERNFIVTFGTEHNTPALKPLTVTCRNDVPLGGELEKINFEGASVIAGHQYKKAKGKEGFLSPGNEPKLKEKEDFVNLGKAVISEFMAR
ncbi:MAG: PHP domain-containing protein [Bacteroidota bacterium]